MPLWILRRSGFQGRLQTENVASLCEAFFVKRVMRLKKLLIIITVVFILALSGAGIYGIYENNRLVVTEYTVKNEKIPDSFSSFKIAQVSDFHNPKSEKLFNKLVDEIKNCQPDIIAITGDFIDSRDTQIDIALDFIEEIRGIAPIYFVTGNHEGRIDDYLRLKNGLEDLGVEVLENECVTLERDGRYINLLGIDDPAFLYIPNVGGKRLLARQIRNANLDRSRYTVLLAHHPEYWRAYTEQKIELALTGHAHGGQIRLPFVGGVYAPGQGFFPEYTGGMYDLDGTVMIVSRGIGNSVFPVRFNNPPELVVVTLEK